MRIISRHGHSQLTGSHIVQPDFAIPDSSGSEELAVRTAHKLRGRILARLIDEKPFFPGGDIPERDMNATACRRQGFAIGAECDGTGSELARLQGGDVLACRHIPKFGGLVAASRSNGLAVGA